MFIGFIGGLAPEVTYPVFQQLATGTGFAASTLRAGAALATEAIVAQGALLLGAGLGGFFVGQKILENLEYTGVAPTVRQVYKTPSNIGQVHVIADYKLFNAPATVFDNIFNSPVVGILSEVNQDDVISYFVLHGNPPVKVGYASAARSLIERPVTITSISKVNGDPIEGLRNVPTYPLDTPTTPLKRPQYVPLFPGLPDQPITPEIVPFDPTEPVTPNEERNPGVVVKIPEVGLQLTFTPTGVRIGRYTDPTTTPYELPNLTTEPPAKKVAAPPCPCPEEKKKADEVLCRVKTLQKEILDDGYTSVATFFGASQCSLVTGLGAGFHKLSVNVVQTPANSYPEQYPSPATAVNYCGWYSWMIDGTPSDRMPINFLSSTYFPPEGATGYMVGLKNGYQASTAYYIRTKKDYIDQC